MRLLIWIILIVGVPLYLGNMLVNGTFDAGPAAFAVLMFLLACAALYLDMRKSWRKANRP